MMFWGLYAIHLDQTHKLLVWNFVHNVTGDIKALQVLLNRVPEQITEDRV